MPTVCKAQDLTNAHDSECELPHTSYYWNFPSGCGTELRRQTINRGRRPRHRSAWSPYGVGRMPQPRQSSSAYAPRPEGPFVAGPTGKVTGRGRTGRSGGDSGPSSRSLGPTSLLSHIITAVSPTEPAQPGTSRLWLAQSVCRFVKASGAGLRGPGRPRLYEY